MANRMGAWCLLLGVAFAYLLCIAFLYITKFGVWCAMKIDKFFENILIYCTDVAFKMKRNISK